MSWKSPTTPRLGVSPTDLPLEQVTPAVGQRHVGGLPGAHRVCHQYQHHRLHRCRGRRARRVRIVTELEQRLLQWDVLGETPCAECSRYGHCGPLDYCDHTGGKVPTCTCLDSFIPVSV
jgi:hypothetical protein